MKEKNGGIRNRLKTICAAAAAAILLAVMLLSAVLLAGKYCCDRRGKTEYQLTRKIAGLEIRGREEQEANVVLPLPNETRLLQVNPDYAGWIFIPGTPVSYPVVYPENNDEYLNRTFEGLENPCGCLFFEASCPPLSSKNTVIYGHNMKSGEMFGSLKKYTEKDFLEKNRTIYLCFGGEWSRYQVQKAYLTDHRDKSPYEPDCAASENARLTLSTCHGREYRLIIQAERAGKESEIQERRESGKPRQKFSSPHVDILF